MIAALGVIALRREFPGLARGNLGLEMKDIAQLLGVSDRTIAREWLFARTWLRRALHDRD